MKGVDDMNKIKLISIKRRMKKNEKELNELIMEAASSITDPKKRLAWVALSSKYLSDMTNTREALDNFGD